MKRLILFIIARSDEIGGAHIHVRDIAYNLLSSNVYTPFVLVGGTGIFCELLESAGIPYLSLSCLGRSIRPLRDIKAICQIYNAISQLKPRLVSIHSGKAGLLVRLIHCFAFRSIPFVFSVHGWSFSCTHRLSRYFYYHLEWLLCYLTSHFVFVSIHDYMLAFDGGMPLLGKSTIIHNGMPDVQRPFALSDSYTSRSLVQLIMVARFESQKDHATLIRALSLISHLPWELTLVGDGPLRPSIEALSFKLNLHPRIKFVGRSSNVASLLSSSDVFVLSTLWEGLPRSIIEALRTPLPIVASSVGGIPELVISHYNGFLCRPGDAHSLSQALASLIINKPLRLSMSNASRSLFVSSFTFQLMMKKYLSLYTRLIDD